jgi:hypothetical protein
MYKNKDASEIAYKNIVHEKEKYWLVVSNDVSSKTKYYGQRVFLGGGGRGDKKRKFYEIADINRSSIKSTVICHAQFYTVT